MEKIMKIGEIEFPVRSTAGSLFSYKRNFRRDMMQDLMCLAKVIPNKDNLTDGDMINIVAGGGLDFDIFYRILWVFAKAANPEIPPMEEWLDTIDASPMEFFAEAFPQVQDMIFCNVQTTIKSKNSQAVAAHK